MTQQLSTDAARAAPVPLPETVAEPALPAEASPGAKAAMEAFSSYVQQMLRRKLEAGLPYSTLVDGCVVWMHPDRSLRVGRAPDSALFQGE